MMMNKMAIYECFDKCCRVLIEPYNNKITKKRTHAKKAGIFIIDSNTHKVLLIQSRGNLWGVPKGTFEKEETPEDCAIREVEEETGIKVDKTLLQNNFIIKNQAHYFYVEMNEIDVKVQNHVENNDANGIGWIKIECIEKLIKHGTIRLNYHTRLCFVHFLKKNFPYTKKKNTNLKKCD